MGTSVGLRCTACAATLTVEKHTTAAIATKLALGAGFDMIYPRRGTQFSALCSPSRSNARRLGLSWSMSSIRISRQLCLRRLQFPAEVENCGGL